MKTAQFGRYVNALFSLDGYQVRLSGNELHRQDDVDLIAVRKKETILIQFNHWDENLVGRKPVQELHKAMMANGAVSAYAITLGRFADGVSDWVERKGVVLMTTKEILEMASRVTAMPFKVSEISDPLEDIAKEERHEREDVLHGQQRWLFVDFAGFLSRGKEFSILNGLLTKHPAYQIIASTLPHLKTIEETQVELGESGKRLVGTLESMREGRYFAIQKYIKNLKDGATIWLAIDSVPREFPEGCTEMIAINKAFGFDASSAERLLEAMLLADKRFGNRP